MIFFEINGVLRSFSLYRQRKSNQKESSLHASSQTKCGSSHCAAGLASLKQVLANVASQQIDN